MAEQVLRGAGIATEVATLRNPIGQFLRNHTASILFSFSFVRDKIRDMLGELSIHYRHSPLAVEDWSAAGGGKKPHPEVHAGDRLPDAPLGDAARRSRRRCSEPPAARVTRYCSLAADASGEAIRQLASDRRSGPSFVSRRACAAVDRSQLGQKLRRVGGLATLVDREGAVCRQHGATGTAVVVVRPDGYIGYRGQPADAERLLGYLDTYLSRGARAAPRRAALRQTLAVSTRLRTETTAGAGAVWTRSSNFPCFLAAG